MDSEELLPVGGVRELDGALGQWDCHLKAPFVMQQTGKTWKTLSYQKIRKSIGKTGKSKFPTGKMRGVNSWDKSQKNIRAVNFPHFPWIKMSWCAMGRGWAWLIRTRCFWNSKLFRSVVFAICALILTLSPCRNDGWAVSLWPLRRTVRRRVPRVHLRYREGPSQLLLLLQGCCFFLVFAYLFGDFSSFYCFCV